MLKSWLGILGVLHAFAADPPFWKSKAKVYERILNREVIVSVNAHERSPQKPRYHLEVRGGGIADPPCPFVFAHSQHYEKLATITGYVERAKYDAATGTMDIKISAYGYTQEMRVRMKANGDGDPRRLEFELVTGPMTGFHGELDFTDVKGGKCEIGMSADYEYEHFPIPRLFLEFGMEVVFQRMAQRLRTRVEEEYKAERGA